MEDHRRRMYNSNIIDKIADKLVCSLVPFCRVGHAACDVGYTLQFGFMDKRFACQNNGGREIFVRLAVMRYFVVVVECLKPILTFFNGEAKKKKKNCFFSNEGFFYHYFLRNLLFNLDRNVKFFPLSLHSDET